MEPKSQYTLTAADAYLLDNWDSNFKTTPDRQREGIFSEYADEEMEKRLSYMARKREYLEDKFPGDREQELKSWEILSQTRKYRIDIQHLLPLTGLILYRTWYHPDSDVSYAHIAAALACTSLPPATTDSEDNTKELEWETLFTVLPELLELPQWDAINYSLTAEAAREEVSTFRKEIQRLLNDTNLNVFGAKSEGESESVQLGEFGMPHAFWMKWTDSFHGALVVGTIALFDKEAALSGKFRFIWFDDNGFVVREARVWFEQVSELAAFRYGESLQNPDFLAFWNDPSKVTIGLRYAFNARV
ncbi:uncharacterized protein N7496_004210 [Penicillium cataractarum]|uniref:Uncharacterized protein n=1 Tax=Penicillium cataractarum TaxID=2100454 RepID=A0A9W9SNY5_9EURO|nr:uncharacterized protein N7496_004210 [Penicillium cataractarum]KAJ5381782.1 hypothetical protein N7496_004210 [Penicillium cataractarum]